MYKVSDAFLPSLRLTHQITARAEITSASGEKTTLSVESGTVNATYQKGTRRTANITVQATSVENGSIARTAQQIEEMLKDPGTQVTVWAGVGTSALSMEEIPMITGRPGDVSWRTGDGAIDFSITDLFWRVTQGRFVNGWTPAKGTRRVSAVQDLMHEVAPNSETNITASDTGSIQSQGDWGENRDAAISTLCTDGNFDAYFDREGRIVIEDSKSSHDLSVWTVSAGDGGVLISADTGTSETRLYNTVVVKPSSTDDSQKWTPQMAQLTTGPRAPAKLGVTIPYFIASPTASSASAALRIAQQRLDAVTGTTETLQITAIGNPALDEGDVIDVLIPSDEQTATQATLWHYYVDSISFDLLSGAMTVTARNESEVEEDASE